MKFLVILVFVLASFSSFSQKMKAYQLFNSKGKKVSFKKMAKDAKNTEFVFFGEYHDNPISHWLQYELMAQMSEEYGVRLKMGFEMFEQDQQNLLDDYLSLKITEKEFEEDARLWPNYSTDYKPLIEYAKENSIKCVASNIPRRYASLLFKHGRDTLYTLSNEEKEWICPLDFKLDTTLSQYASISKMAVHMKGMSGKYLMEAQAIKDATMAHFILNNMEANDVMLHFNGAFHSDFFQGIMWYVREKRPDSKVVTISTVSQSSFKKLEKDYIGSADYIICVSESMTSTH